MITKLVLLLVAFFVSVPAWSISSTDNKILVFSKDGYMVVGQDDPKIREIMSDWEVIDADTFYLNDVDAYVYIASDNEKRVSVSLPRGYIDQTGYRIRGFGYPYSIGTEIIRRDLYDSLKHQEMKKLEQPPETIPDDEYETLKKETIDV